MNLFVNEYINKTHFTYNELSVKLKRNVTVELKIKGSESTKVNRINKTVKFILGELSLRKSNLND